MLKHALVVTLALASGAFAQSKLTIKPITASPEGFMVNATLITGEKDAILIDAAFTRADAHRLVSAVLDSHKNLTTVYVTHSHPDHYFGAEVIKQAFPKVKILATKETIAEIQKTWKGKVAQWGPLYGQNLTDKPVVPELLTGKSLTLDGETLEIVGPVQGDDAHNTYVWIPSAKTVIAGDISYQGTHVWTAETKPADRKAWAATIEKLEALKPVTVIPGHQKADAKTDTSSLAFVKAYLMAFDEAVAASKTSEEAQAKVQAKYGELALDPILKFGADAQFAAAPAAKK